MTIAATALLASWTYRPVSADFSGAQADDNSIAVWVVGQTNGGISRPAGTTSCSSWVAFDTTTPGVLDGQPVERPDARLFTRTCEGQTQYAWVTNLTPQQLAQVAFDQATAQLPQPAPSFAPPAESMFVNYETWFAVEPVDPVTATASIPGLSVTVTATPTEITLHTGTQVDGDITSVTCTPWGSTYYAANGCTWTPNHPSVEQVTGTTDYRYHASIDLVWLVRWRASNGTTGDLGTTTSTTDVLIAVREIQTVGTRTP
jgi:hypothetical protein